MFFFTICRTRLLRLERQIIFLGIGSFFTNFLHGAADAPDAWEKKDLYIIKHFSEAPKRSVTFKISCMCLKKSCLPHTASEARASSQTKPQTIYFGICSFSLFAAHGC